MFDNLKKYNIVLASNSPRRKELLQRLGLPFRVRTLLGVDETWPRELRGADVPQYLSRKKAEAYRGSLADNELVITADTVVCIDGQVLGKPQNVNEPRLMLRQLSGHTHHVYTGVTVMTVSKSETICADTAVTFATLSDEEIDYYVDNYLPLDKAGAYGIQEWIGLVAVENLQGSFHNVMGLPMQRLYTLLKRF